MGEERKRLIGDMRNPVTRICVECGKEFSTYRAIQKICSPQCRVQREERKRKEWYAENRDYILQWQKNAKANQPGKAYCRICGKLIKQAILVDHKGRVTMHDECVYDDAVKTLQSGKELSEIQKQRLRTRGFVVRDLKKEVNKIEEEFSYRYD